MDTSNVRLLQYGPIKLTLLSLILYLFHEDYIQQEATSSSHQAYVV